MTGIRETLNDPNVPVWDMLADGGIDLDRVSVAPDGVWNLISQDTRIAFGPATTETGSATEGWNWTRYDRNGDSDEITAQDWAPTDEALLDVLRAETA
jgi:hypothetical protein